MKKVIFEELNEGLESLLGEKVLLLCANYFYVGVLEGVNESCILLKDPAIVYETGPWTDKQYKDVQKLHVDKFYVQRSAIESFGISK